MTVSRGEGIRAGLSSFPGLLPAMLGGRLWQCPFFFSSGMGHCLPSKKSPEFRSQMGGFIDNGAVGFWARTLHCSESPGSGQAQGPLCFGDLPFLHRAELSKVSFSSNQDKTSLPTSIPQTK